MQINLQDYCKTFGPQVGPLPPGVDGTQLLWAMSGVETSFGTNNTPRHEPAYDAGGRYATHAPMPDLLRRFGRAAACSYGPWQVMLCNAPSFSPDQLQQNTTLAATATVRFLNSRLHAFRPKNLDEIGECWNAGSIRPDLDYTTKLTHCYGMPMFAKKPT